MDGAGSNPKHWYNGQSAAKVLTEQGSTTIPIAGVGRQVIGRSKW